MAGARNYWHHTGGAVGYSAPPFYFLEACLAVEVKVGEEKIVRTVEPLNVAEVLAVHFVCTLIPIYFYRFDVSHIENAPVHIRFPSASRFDRSLSTVCSAVRRFELVR